MVDEIKVVNNFRFGKGRFQTYKTTRRHNPERPHFELKILNNNTKEIHMTW